MNWFIEDHNQILIHITDGWRHFYIPKFRISMTVDEPYLFLHWHDRERGDGGDERMLQIDYLDVVSGYDAYLSGVSSATDLMADIDAMIVSALLPITDYDRDAQAFIDAVNSVTTLPTVIEDEINTLTLAFKSAGVWTKGRAGYPLVGGTALSIKWNLFNPVDSDPAFRLTPVGSPTSSYNGISTNGTSSYYNTHLIPTSHLTQDSTTLYFSRRNTGNSGVEIGSEAPAASGMLLAARNVGTSVHIQYQFPSNYMTVAQATAVGRWGGVRTSSTVQKTFKDNVQQGATDTDAAAGWANLTYPLFIGATNSSGSPANYCACDLDFVAVFDGLTDVEYAAMDAAVLAFNTNIGR